jgi:hypothetical protein
MRLLDRSFKPPKYKQGDLKKPPNGNDADGNFNSHDSTRMKTLTHQTIMPTRRAAAMKLTAHSLI